MKQYKIGLVGIGAVGTEIVKMLRERNFPASEIRVMATRERDEEIAGEVFHVIEATPDAFTGLDIVLFAGTEGSKGAAQQLGEEAIKRGVVVIDNGDDFRMKDHVPLVIPEVNGEALDSHQGFIANPNCSTIITLMGLAPLHKVAGIKHASVATYQSVSGSGRDAIDEMEQQMQAYAKGAEMPVSVYPHQIALNLLPKIGSEKPEIPGFTSEEAKLTFESRKILGCPNLQISSTCVRVPVFYAHAMAVHASFERPLSVEEAREILQATPGVVVIDDLTANQFPMPLNTGGGDMVNVGRIRVDPALENGLALWICGDNIRKGAAQNAIQIAETLIQRKLI